MTPEQLEKKMQEFLKKFSSPASFRFFPSLSRKKTGQGGVEYANFSGRMFALTLDMLLLLMLLFPLFEWIAAAAFPHFNREQAMAGIMTALAGLMQQQITPEQAYGFVLSTGVLEHVLFNSAVQALVTGVVVIAIWNLYATTPGMWLLNMHIADADTGGKPSLRAFILRYVGVMLAMIPLMLGMIWIVFDKRGQGWQDKMANTVVIKMPRSWTWWKKKA